MAINRFNYNYSGEITEHDDYSLELQFSGDAIAEVKENEFYHFTELLWLLDCYAFGEAFSLGNFATGHKIYNVYSDKLYIYTDADLQELAKGNLITLEASEPTEEDREEWEKWG